MPVHPLDFDIQAHLFSTPELMALFDEKARFQRWLSFEAALAEVQSDLGIIPREAAEEISKNAKIELLDIEQIKKGYTKSRNSLIPILNGLRAACKNSHGAYVHFGATTQDVIDTGCVLEIQATLSIIYRDLRQIEQLLIHLTETHRDTPMIGRTHSQQAIPITFGMKSAVWLSEIRRHIERLKAMYPRVLAGQLSGAVGSMAALGEHAPKIAKETLAKLGLQHMSAPWHTARDNMAEVSSFYTMTCGSVTKICNEIFQLGKSEIMELREPPAGSQASSTMPHKRNPVLCERVSVLNSHVRSLNSIIMESMIHENERDPRSLWSEWLAMPQISIYTCTALSYTLQILAGLEVFEDRMLTNLHLYKDTIASEWLLFKLADKIGKTKAHNELQKIIKRAEEQDRSIKETLLADKTIGHLFSNADLTMLDTPENYTGQAQHIVDEVLAEVCLLQKSDKKTILEV